MKKKFLFSSLFMIGTLAYQQTHAQIAFNWANKSKGLQNERASQNISDGLGFTYITGSFEGTVDFDPGIGELNLSSLGETDAFIQKLDPNGNLCWVKRLGGALKESGTAIALDVNNNVYIAGVFEGTADINPDDVEEFNQTSVGLSDVFLIKLDSDGHFSWGNSYGGSDIESARAIKVDRDENIVIVGDFTGECDFNPSIDETNNLSSTKIDVSFVKNGYILKLDAKGNYTWAKAINGNGKVNINSVDSWNSSNYYFIGTFEKTTDFDPNQGITSLTPMALQDVFILKLTFSGDFVWAKQFGAECPDEAAKMVIDRDENIYFTGSFGAGGDPLVVGHYTLQIDMDPSRQGRDIRTGTSYVNFYVTSFDKDGNYRWSYTLGANRNPGKFSRSMSGYSLDIDINNSIYVIGSINGNADFDPGTGINSINNIGSTASTMFLLKLTGNGVYQGAVGIKGVDATILPSSVAVDDFSNVYVSGHFNKTVNFNPSASAIFNLSSEVMSTFDVYNAKYSTVNMGSRLNDESKTDLEKTLDWAMYPNPSIDIVHIQTNESGTLEIYSITGQIISSEILFAGTNQKELDQMTSGSYIVRFISEKGVITKRLFIGE